MTGARPETVTVLFTDVVASTAWRTRVGDPVADVRMAELSEATREVVRAHGGTVVKGLGDGVMATFTSAASALDTAAALQVVAQRLSFGGDAFRLRVGVSSGDMVRDGEDWSGTAAIEASRLCADCAGGAVLVADTTVHLSRGRSMHLLRRVGESVLRGFVEPIDVYEFAWQREDALVPDGLARAADGPLVGRQRELEHAAALLDRIAAGGAATLLIVGEPGVGKTRLTAQVAALAAERRFTVLHGRCDEGMAAPHQPIVEAFGAWLSTCPGPALSRVLGSGAPELVRLWPDLGDWLAAPRSVEGVDPDVQRWRLFEAVAGLLRAVASERPLVLIVDDLQWAEPSTSLLLKHLVKQAVSGSALVATARRAELGDGLGDVEHWDLEGLDVEEVADLVELQGGARPPVSLASELWRRTAGNPFFLKALIKHLDDAAELLRADGSWASAGSLDAVGVPTRVRDVIARRVSKLTPTARRVLETAAVAGLVFDERVVRGVLDVDVDATIDALDEALAAGLVRELDAGRWTFVHDLARDAVLNGLSRTRSARLHWRVAEELERHEGASRAGEIAGHYAAGADLGDPATIVRSALRAGEDALDSAAFEEAANHFRTALTALDRQPVDADLRFRVLTSLGRALNAISEPDVAEQLWLEAADLARTAGDPERLFAAIRGYGYVFRLRADVDLVQLLDEVLQLAGPGDSALRASALGWRAVPWVRGDLMRPPVGDATAVDKAVAMARRIGDPVALSSTLRSRLTLKAGGPDARGMLRDAEELMALRSEVGDTTLANFGDDAAEWRDMARALLRLGHRAAAEDQLVLAKDRARRSGMRMASCVAVMLEAALATASGRFADAKRLAAEAAQEGGRHVGIVELGYSSQILAARMEQGRLDEVIATLRTLDSLEVDLRAWQAMLVGALIEADERAEAAMKLDALLDDPNLGIPRDYGAPLAIRYVAEACLSFGEIRRAAELLPVIQPWAEQLLVVTVGTSIEGASDRSIGHLLATLGRLDEADEAYTAAARLERDGGFPPLVARTELWHARALLTRNRDGDQPRARDMLNAVLKTAERLGMRALAAEATKEICR